MPNCKHGFDLRFCAACAGPGQSPAEKRTLIQQRAAIHKSPTTVEREAYEAVYAYEAAATKLKGKTTRATRTWPLIKKKGVIAAIEGIVRAPKETPAYRVLVEMGMEDMSFEAVVLRNKDAFSEEAVAAAAARLLTR